MALPLVAVINVSKLNTTLYHYSGWQWSPAREWEWGWWESCI